MESTERAVDFFYPQVQHSMVAADIAVYAWATVFSDVPIKGSFLIR